MKASLIKDFLTCKSILKSYIFILSIFLVISYLSKNFGMIGGILAIIPLMVLINSFAYDEKSKWEKMALCSTITRKQLVLSKVTFSIILTLFSAVLVFVSYFICGGDVKTSLIVATVLGIVSTSYCLILIPMLFKFGTEKARTIMIAALILPFMLVMVFIIFGEDILMTIITTHLVAFLIAIVVFVIFIWILMIYIGMKIVAKKDY